MDSDSDRSDYEEEAPQIVVLKKGDLTAEQAETEQKRIEKGEIIFFFQKTIIKMHINDEALKFFYKVYNCD